MHTLEILAIIAVSAVFMLLIWRIKAALLGTLPAAGESRFSITDARTPAELEHAVRRLIWLRERDGLTDEIVIYCGDFSSEMLRMAHIFAREHEYIRLE